MPLPDACRRSRSGRNENGRWRRERGGQLRIAGTLRSSAITFLMPRFRTGVPWSRGWVARKYCCQSGMKLREEKEDEKERKRRGKGMKDAVAVWHAIRGVTPPSPAFLFLSPLSSVHLSLLVLFSTAFYIVVLSLCLTFLRTHLPTFRSHFLLQIYIHIYARISHYKPFSATLDTRSRWWHDCGRYHQTKAMKAWHTDFIFPQRKSNFKDD